MLTLKQLSYFVALAEERNFGRAAQRVHVTQPALSMQLRELEASLGARLVERRPRDVRLTRTGREVLDRARRILAEAQELEALARRQGLSGRLNLGVIPTVAPYLLPEALGRLRRAGLARDLRVREAQTGTLLEALDAGHLDAVVIAQPAPVPERLAEPLVEDRFLLAGAPERLEATLAGGGAPRPGALDPEQLLLLDEGHCLADQALEVCALDRRQTRFDLGASSLATLCGLVAGGFGLTFLPEIALRSESAAAPTMALRRFAAPEPARSLALVRRAATSDDGWFGELAGVLRAAGQELVGHARITIPPPDGVIALDKSTAPGYVVPK
jgi:LysR family transcriptional regulator, hydrogen peroxide-inducible genes activator